jgi:hypothetical protein
MGIKAVEQEIGTLTVDIKERVNGAGTLTIQSADSLV